MISAEYRVCYGRRLWDEVHTLVMATLCLRLRLHPFSALKLCIVFRLLQYKGQTKGKSYCRLNHRTVSILQSKLAFLMRMSSTGPTVCALNWDKVALKATLKTIATATAAITNTESRKFVPR